jgi:Tfp pilus assembly protein PilO
MQKILKNLHWIIIVITLVSFAMKYLETDERLTIFEQDRESQKLILKKNKNVKKEIESFYQNINEQKEKIELVAREIEKTQQLLPSEISDSENVGKLKKMAEDVNIKDVSITPEQEEDRGFFYARKYKVVIKATFLQALILFEKIGDSTNILNIGEMNFQKINKQQRGKFQVLSSTFYVEAFRFNQNYKEDRGIDQIGKMVDEKVVRPASGRGSNDNQKGAE